MAKATKSGTQEPTTGAGDSREAQWSPSRLGVVGGDGVLRKVSGTMVHLPGPQGRDQWFDPIAVVKIEQQGPTTGHVVLNPGKSSSTTNAPFDGISPAEVIELIEGAKRASLVMFSAAALGQEFFSQLFVGTYGLLQKSVTEGVLAQVEGGLEGAIERAMRRMVDESKKNCNISAPTEPA